MKRIIMKYILFCFILLPAGFTNSVRAAELSCSYIDDIQQKFLKLHINSSNRIQKSFWRRYYSYAVPSYLEQRVRDQFIKALDMDKIYFTVRDVRNIRRWTRNLFADLKQDNCSALDRVYQLYLKRVTERVEFAKEYLKKPFHIDTTIALVLDPRQRKRLTSQRALDNFQVKYMQYQMANAIHASDEELYKDKLKEATKNVQRYYDRMQKQVKSWNVHLTAEEKKQCYKRRKSSGTVTICRPDKWYSIYLNSFAQSWDPHSSYLSREDQEEFEINMRLSLDGIGAELGSQYGRTVIRRLIPGGCSSSFGPFAGERRYSGSWADKKKDGKYF